ncbi:MAG: hypothetical protein NXY59_02845 [Aigarchaeota archaeon]|nr:hypothetical protein [Candidatus Pelearchaeum maunauluense]
MSPGGGWSGYGAEPRGLRLPPDVQGSFSLSLTEVGLMGELHVGVLVVKGWSALGVAWSLVVKGGLARLQEPSSEGCF